MQIAICKSNAMFVSVNLVNSAIAAASEKSITVLLTFPDM